MSWLYSRALVEEFSAVTCSDGARSALSSGSHTPQAFLPSDKMTAFSRPSRFGMTFSPLTDDLGAELLTWFLAASRARTSASQARAQASAANDPGCGPTWRGSLARFAPATSSWRTVQPSLLGDSDECSVTWPRSGMTADGQCWELPMLERRTSATGFGLWRTPTVGMINADRAKDPEYTARKEAKGQTITLADQVRHERLWPTPTVCGNHNRKGASATSGDGLATAVKKFPTPTAHNAKEGAHPSEYERNCPTLATHAGGPLNPTWVEKLMGWVDDWTSLDPISHVKMCFWLMGMCDGAETGRTEVLRMLRKGNAAKEIQRAIGRPVGFSEAAILLAELCEHSNRPDEARVFMACAEALEEGVRGVRLHEGTTGAPHRPGQDKQRAGEHPDTVQALSRLLAHHGKTYWQDGRWEDAIPRVATGVAARVDRLRAIGNGQVPQCAAQAWRLLTKDPT